MVTRAIQDWIQGRKQSVLLLGPRQTGKSTLARALKPSFELNLMREPLYLELLATPGRFEEMVEPQCRPGALIFIDEIQRVPSLLNSVQVMIDSQRHARGDRAARFLLTGSSARKLRRGQANLLPGRILTAEMGGLTSAELGYELDTERALSLGTLPSPYLSKDRNEASELLESYASTYLREEIQAEALARNIAGFSRFLGQVASFSGLVLDVSKAASKAKVSRTSALRFFEILEDTMVAERIYPYGGWESLDIIKHPKLFLFDVGVLNGLLGNFNPSADRRGLLFEHLLCSQLRHSGFAKRKKVEIHYLRTRGGMEIDFVVRVDGRLYLIEAKSSSPEPGETRAIEQLYSVKKAGLAGAFVAVAKAGPERRREGVHILPWQKVLREVGL